MKDYFDTEMRMLNEAAQEFARIYPEQASQLNLSEVRDRDPYIERLLEGMAFLTAQIRQRIDDDVPEICESLLAQLWPHFIRPYPSAAVFEFSSRPNQLREAKTLEAGVEMGSDWVGEERQKIQCWFRTVSPLVLRPLALLSMRSAESTTGGTLLELDFQIDGRVPPAKLDLEDLSIFLNGFPVVTFDLLHALTSDTREVRVRFSTDEKTETHRLGDQKSIQPGHLDARDAMLPRSGRSFSGLHLLHDYFCFREKYLFVRILGLDGVPWPEKCDRFTVQIDVDAVFPSDYGLSADNFRLHCVPAINLHESQAEPLRMEQHRAEYWLKADAERAQAVSIYSVNRVQGAAEKSKQTFEYHAMHSFRHRQDVDGRYFHVTTRDQGRDIPDTFISVGGKRDTEVETLGCDITATNGHYPRRYLSERSIKTPGKGFPEFISFANITRPTPAYYPPSRSDYHWGLVAHLGLNYSSLAELETLRDLLRLYDWTEGGDNERKIEGIREVELQSFQDVSRGVLMRGLEVRLTMHEGNYAAIGDIYLFGLVLHRFFSMHANINTLVRTRVYCHPSRKELKWDPIPGESSLI